MAGVEGAGSIVAVGEGVTDLDVGDRVGWVAAAGSYAERVVVPAEKAVPLPDDVSSELAAAVLLQGMTAQYLATGTYAVQPGDDVLVHAAAGGVGLLLTQTVKALGGRVIATTSGGEKAELARNAGADEVIGYEGFAERVRELTDGVGAAVVYDGVGQATFDESLASLRERGTMVLYGAASGPVPPFDPMRLEHGGSLFLTGRHSGTTRQSERSSSAAQLTCWAASRRAARRPDRRALPARASAAGPGGSRRPQDDGQAAADSVVAIRCTRRPRRAPRRGSRSPRRAPRA